ncbi:MAG: type II toxin-antitoxin system RelB/DinJ family antitoxin [Clostridia bacterium]|nr:type II toxin-antitoxin system RelB/DinJ family antitoxin [Clostridia bacterium]
MPQVFAQAKVDKTLRDEVNAILEELGLDLPTAIRIYMKSIVREKGIPMSLSLAPCDAPCANCECKCTSEEEVIEEAAEESAPEAAPVKASPKKAAPKAKAIGADDFIRLICAVPEGSLTRWKDMEEYLSKTAGVEIKRTLRFKWPKTNEEGEAIPYWRVVTERGAVRDDKACTKELQEEMLKREGHAFVSAGHDRFSGIKVENYKKKLVNFDRLA